MKVNYLTNEYPPHVYGGAGVHVTYLAREMAKLTDVQVYCFGDQQVDQETLRVRGIPLPAGLGPVPSELHGIFSTFQRNLDYFREGLKGDIIHCHTWYSHLGGILARLTLGSPLVVTTHSLEPLRPWKREQLGRGYDASCWVEKQALELADAVIAVSEGTRQDILNHFQVSPEKIHVIPNGIDIEEYQPRPDEVVLKQYGIDPSKPYLLFVGRITRQKGIIHLMDAVAHLDPAIQVVLCAGAPDTQEIGEEMEKRADKIHTERGGLVWIREMLPRGAMVALYSGAAVFCCPSVYEPFGIINLEAMACGTPVVGSQLGGIQEIITHGETGLLVPLEFSSEVSGQPADPDKFSKDLAGSINKLFQNNDLRIKMGDRARAHVVNKYPWSRIAQQTLSVYEDLLSSH